MAAHVTIVEHGHILLTPEIQKALGMADGTSVSLSVERGKIIVRPLDHDPIKAMQDLFVGANYSLEDDLMEMRREEDEHQKRKYGW